MTKNAPKPRNLINYDAQAKRNDKLNARARAKGWKGISEALTALIKDEIELPQKETRIEGE